MDSIGYIGEVHPTEPSRYFSGVAQIIFRNMVYLSYLIVQLHRYTSRQITEWIGTVVVNMDMGLEPGKT